VLVRVSDPLVVIVFVLVIDRVGCGIPAQPERFDELLALFIRLELFECGPLFIRDDVTDIIIQPSP